ncbi:MAG: hypothetical protein Q9166_005364 [cf. Caloplaca sp. 2 TL-2023]
MDPDQPVHEAYERLIQIMYSRLPQELIDQIQESVFEMVFNISLNGQFRSPARPQVLTLSQCVHNKYKHRIRTDNICTVATSSTKRYKLISVKGHLSDPYSFPFRYRREDPVA